MALPTTEQKQGLDLFAGAPAGISLTDDNSKYPWGNPPREADPDIALTKMIDRLEDPSSKENMKKLLLAGISVEVLIESMIFKGVESGEFSLDTGLLLKGPLSLYMADMAEQDKLPYRLLEDEKALDREDIDDETILRIMKKNNPNMFEFLNEQVNQVVRMGGPENMQRQDAESAPQSFLNSEKEIV